MDEERIQHALARIAAATSRIEAAASRPRPALATAVLPLSAPNDNDLARRHEALKREAWAALAELDSLIEAIEA